MQQKNPNDSATVSRRKDSEKSVPTEARPTACSVRSINATSDETECPALLKKLTNSGHRAGFRARNRGDSERNLAMKPAKTSGNAPPTTKSARQPSVGRIFPANDPASMPPSGTQTI